MRYRLDPTWWRHSRADGETLVAGTPTRIFRFRSSATALLDTLEAGGDLDATTGDLQTRLVEAGVIHPYFPTQPDGADLDTCDDPGTIDLAQVTVVIPALVDERTSLEALVTRLPEAVSIVIVDDGSPSPIVDVPRARILRNMTSLGPAAARNRGLSSVTTDFVLFLDHDVIVPETGATIDFWQPLLWHLQDPSVVLVAPRVRSRPGSTVLARYETSRSPLDMGDVPARIHPGSRVAYVPSAAVLIRTRTLRDVGGFDESLRYGEDVDLVWRLIDGGHMCRYEPGTELHHTPRQSWRAFLDQRFRYGTAAASLEARHPGSTRPVRLNRWSATVVALVLCRRPVLAVGVLTTTIVRLSARLATMPDRWLVSLRLVCLSHLFALRAVLDSSVRTWWPITALVSFVSRPLRAVITAHLLVRPVSMWITTRVTRRRHGRAHDPATLDPIRTLGIGIADDLAYGSGVWVGAIRARDSACLRPRVD